MKALLSSLFVLICMTSRGWAFQAPNLNEMREMAYLCLTMNGAGLTDPPEALPEHFKLTAPFDPADPVDKTTVDESAWTRLTEGRSDDKTYFWGFPRYGNRWAIYQKGHSKKYAIVIRGTVANEKLNLALQRSIVLDALAFTTKANNVWFSVPKQGGGEEPHVIQLAENDSAGVHIGFAYGLVDILLHERSARGPEGLLTALRGLPQDSEIIITGHSQGAAIATLLHAFLHHRASEKNGYYGLADAKFKLTSYVFAQPKPGDWQFAMDFARGLANRGETAFVINNANDWVPQVPLTVEWPSTVPLAGFVSALPKPTQDGVNLYLKATELARTQLSGLTVNSQGVLDKSSGIIAELEQTCRASDGFRGILDDLRSGDFQKKLTDCLSKLGDARTLVVKASYSGFTGLDAQYFASGPQRLRDGSEVTNEQRSFGASLTYMPVGTLVPLPLCQIRDDVRSRPPYNEAPDKFLEHHMATYFDLLSDANRTTPETIPVGGCTFTPLKASEAAAGIPAR